MSAACSAVSPEMIFPLPCASGMGQHSEQRSWRGADRIQWQPEVVTVMPRVRAAQIALRAEVVQVPRETGEGAQVAAIRWAGEIRAVCRDVDLEGVA